MTPEREIQQVLARYCRAVDARDGAAVAALYTDDGRERVSYNRAGVFEPLAEFTGVDAIARAVSTVLAPHPPLGWAHHTTHDHIIEIDGDHATMDAQFVVFEADGSRRAVTPTLSGYYRIRLRYVDGRWSMTDNETIIDLPLTVEGA